MEYDGRGDVRRVRGAPASVLTRAEDSRRTPAQEESWPGSALSGDGTGQPAAALARDRTCATIVAYALRRCLKPRDLAPAQLRCSRPRDERRLAGGPETSGSPGFSPRTARGRGLARAQPVLPAGALRRAAAGRALALRARHDGDQLARNSVKRDGPGRADRGRPALRLAGLPPGPAGRAAGR